MTANILIVDDLETNVKLLEAKILKEYYNVFTAQSAMAAFKVLQEQKIDVVLLDCMMPEMDGFEACRKIKSTPETMHIPVVIVTALSDIEDKIKGLEAGADEFLTKPVDDTSLFARLKSLSAMKSTIDELKLRNETNIQLGAPAAKLFYDFSGSKILIVNDDPVQSNNIVVRVNKITNNVEVATDRKQMHKIIDNNFTPDVIIISCQMEEYDPLRLLASLKTNENAKYSSVIMLSEEDTMKVVLRALDLGASEYIILPVESNELIARIKTQLQRKYYTDSLRSNIDQGMNLAIRDSVSGLFNRRYFETHLPSLINKASQSGKTLYAMIVDIDNFKNANSEYGYRVGDEIIKSVSVALLKRIPVTDLTARYGGDEFIAIIYDSPQDVKEIAEDVRQNIQQYSSAPVTVSIGITELKKNDSASDFLYRADRALFEAKSSGKNKTSLG